MKKPLSFILCMSLLLSAFAFAPIVSAQSGDNDVVLDFEAYNEGDRPDNFKFGNSVEGEFPTVTADKTIVLTAKLQSNGKYDPIFFANELGIIAQTCSTAIFSLKWTGVDEGLHPEIFFNHPGENWSADRRISATDNANFKVANSNGFVDIHIPLSHNLWNGEINAIRFDPADKAGTYELKSVTFVSSGIVAARFSSNGGAGTYAPFVGEIGDTFVLPANPFTKTGANFIGWTIDDDETVLSPGDVVTLTGNMTVSVAWEDILTEPIVGKNWEFETGTEGFANGGKLIVTHNDGKLILTATSDDLDARLASPSGMNMAPAFQILKILYKTTGTVSGSGDVFYAQGSDGISGGRKRSFTPVASTDFIEVVIDMGTADGNWFASNINRFWVDIIRAKQPAVTEIEYIRFFRKGSTNVSYNANAGGDTVTGMPANDGIAAKGVGYLLSGVTPKRAGYEFLGWSLTPTGAVVSSIDVVADTVVYAQWEALGLVNATFTKGADGITGTDPADISVPAKGDITLPANPYTREGHTFAGWYDGSKLYAAGSSYATSTDDVEFHSVWNLSAEQLSQIVFTPENGTSVSDNRNLHVTVQYPVDIDASTVLAKNFNTANLHTARLEGTDTIGLYFISDRGETRTIAYDGTTILSADNTLIIPSFNYSISVAANNPDDGENLLSNGDFELPFFPVYEKSYTGHLSFTDDTPTGTGTALKVKGIGNYTLTRFPAKIEANTNYFYSFDAKVLTNQTGDEVTTNIYPAMRIVAGGDKPIHYSGMPSLTTNTTKGEGWKHFEGFFYDSAEHDLGTEFAVGDYYLQMYANPKDGSGVDYLLDNVVFKKAYNVVLSPGTIDGVEIIGETSSSYGIKGGTIVLDNPGYLAAGYVLSGWTDGTAMYDLGDTYTVPLGGATLTAIWDESPEFEITFKGGKGGGTGPDAIYSEAGFQVEMPECTFTYDGHLFKGWSKDGGITLYQAGDYYLALDTDVEFTAYWSKESAMSHSAEFNIDGDHSGWTSNGGFNKLEVKNGIYDIVTTIKDFRLGKSITDVNNTDGKEPLDSEFSMMRIRYRILSEGTTAVLRWQRVGDEPGSTDVVTAEQAQRRKAITYTGDIGEWVEQTIELPTDKWNGYIRTMWLDPIEYVNASKEDNGHIQFDYIRFYRKGDLTVTYNSNAVRLEEEVGDSVVITNVPAPETKMGAGTGYRLSSTVPVAVDVDDYMFLGWSLEPHDINSVDVLQPYVLAGNSMTLTESTTVYAVWAEIPTELKAYFVAGNENATGTVDTIVEEIVDGKATITLPENTFVLEGYLFNGWLDSFGLLRKPGDQVQITSNETFTALWYDLSTLVTYNIGQGATSTDDIPVTSVETGDTYGLVSAVSYGLSKEGHYFAGWEFEGDVYSNGARDFVKPDYAVEFTARWNPNPTNVPAFGEDIYGGSYDFEDGYFAFVPSAGVLKVVDDPVNAGNKVIKYEKQSNFASMGYNVILEGGRRYFVSFKAYLDPEATDLADLQTNFRYNSTDHAANMAKPEVKGEWIEVNRYFDVEAGDTFAGQFTFYTNPMYSTSGKYGYVLYDDISVTPGYKLTFNANGGKFEDEATAKTVWSQFDSYDSSELAEPAKDGYIFAGWATTAGGEAVETLQFSADATYYAVWEDELDPEPVGILGDVNEDGEVDGLDVLAVMRFSISAGEPTAIQIKLGDVNGDGSLNGLDALAMARYSVGFDDGLGIGFSLNE